MDGFVRVQPVLRSQEIRASQTSQIQHINPQKGIEPFNSAFGAVKFNKEKSFLTQLDQFSSTEIYWSGFVLL